MIFLARSGWLAYDVAPDLAISSGETDVAMTATATAYIYIYTLYILYCRQRKTLTPEV